MRHYGGWLAAVLVGGSLGGWLTAALGASPAAFVRASSEHPGDYQAIYAVDGDPETRWASHGGRPGEYIEIDLGRV